MLCWSSAKSCCSHVGPQKFQEQFHLFYPNPVMLYADQHFIISTLICCLGSWKTRCCKTAEAYVVARPWSLSVILLLQGFKWIASQLLLKLSFLAALVCPSESSSLSFYILPSSGALPTSPNHKASVPSQDIFSRYLPTLENNSPTLQ